MLERFEQDLVGSVEPWLSGVGDGAEAAGGRDASFASTEAALTRMLHVFREHAAMVNAVNQAASANPAVYQRWQTRSELSVGELPGWLADPDLAIYCIIIAAAWRSPAGSRRLSGGSSRLG